MKQYWSCRILVFIGFLFFVVITWFILYNNRKPFRNLETNTWKSITISYCIGDGINVKKKKQTITDTDVLNQLRILFKGTFLGHSWDYAYLHVASKWNKIIVTLENGEKEALVLHAGELNYYAENKCSIVINIGEKFESYLTKILQAYEKETVHLYFNDNEHMVINQETMLIPDNNKWREEKFPGEDKANNSY
jgi:hypothetical protein